MIVMPRDSDLATMWMLTARSIAQDMSLGTWCSFSKNHSKNIKCAFLKRTTITLHITKTLNTGTWTWKDTGRPELLFLLDQYSLIVTLEALRVRKGIEHVPMSDNSIHCVLNCHGTKTSMIDAFEKATFVHYQQISNLCHVQSSFLSVLRESNEYLRSVLAPVRQYDLNFLSRFEMK